MNIIEQGFVEEAERAMRVAQAEVDAAMQAMENHADNGPPALLGTAFEHMVKLRNCLHHIRGQMAALQQMVELQELERAATERPVQLRIVAR